jgi:hypothetical protein
MIKNCGKEINACAARQNLCLSAEPVLDDEHSSGAHKHREEGVNYIIELESQKIARIIYGATVMDCPFLAQAPKSGRICTEEFFCQTNDQKPCQKLS